MKYRVKRHAVVQPLDQSYRFIALTRNQNAIVDATDFDWLNQWNWLAWWNPKTESFYATRKGMPTESKIVYMHRFILGDVENDVDHENQDTLDNRRKNLRSASRTMNMLNRGPQWNNKTGFKGVCWNPKANRFIAQAGLHRRNFNLGRYKTAEAAACAYDLFALLNHKEFARTNLLGATPPV